MEIWKNVDIFNPKYQISNYGRVRIAEHKDSKNRYYPEKILKTQKTQSGYHTVCLSKKRKQKRFLVHRLVAFYFVENPQKYEYVNHKNENKDDNNSENLEWCTWQYNAQYGTRIKRCSEKRRKRVCQYSKDGTLIKIWNGVREIERELGYASSNISACCLHKPSFHTRYGFIWRFENDPMNFQLFSGQK